MEMYWVSRHAYERTYERAGDGDINSRQPNFRSSHFLLNSPRWREFFIKSTVRFRGMATAAHTHAGARVALRQARLGAREDTRARKALAHLPPSVRPKVGVYIRGRWRSKPNIHEVMHYAPLLLAYYEFSAFITTRVSRRRRHAERRSAADDV